MYNVKISMKMSFIHYIIIMIIIDTKKIYVIVNEFHSCFIVQRGIFLIIFKVSHSHGRHVHQAEYDK